MKLGEPRPGDDAAVSALAFSPLGNVLAVGHANGDIAFWELRRAGWECGKVVKGGQEFSGSSICDLLTPSCRMPGGWRMPSDSTCVGPLKNSGEALKIHIHQVAVSADAHVTTVVACTFLEGSSSTERSTALSSDSRGRLVFHNVTGYLSITNFIAGSVLS